MNRYDVWLALLLRGYDPRTREVTNPAVDCTGSQVRWDGPAVACADGAVTKAMLPGRPLDEKDVVVAPYADRLRIVWVVTARYASGDALGPVAIVETKSRRLVVRVAGVLRAYPQRSTLRIENLGNKEVLVAEGEHCTTADPSSCHRAARVLPLRGDHFVPEPLVSEAGNCMSASWFDLAREESERLDSGWRRRYQLAASLSFGPTSFRVDEEVVVQDSDPRRPETAPRLVRRAHGERAVRLVDGRLVGDGQSLWNKVTIARE